MRVLLVEPNYRRLSKRKLEEAAAFADQQVEAPNRAKKDDTLWYPPLGLMKLARFHVNRGDEVFFVNGCKKDLLDTDLFNGGKLWDRIYITTLFTFHFAQVVKTINFYKDAVGGTKGKIFVGGIMATLMADAIHEETGVYPVKGVLSSPSQIGLTGTTNIDELTPYYELLDRHVYGINETFYAYTSRGCVHRCPWCGVPTIEPKFVEYIDIKSTVKALRDQYGDMPILKLMDNNVLASPRLADIVNDLVELGYGRGQFTDRKRQRVVDFNQGVDARFVTEDRMKILSQLDIRPMRIAFDQASDKKTYVKAVELAHKYGVRKFSNYMLYNFHDTPEDLYDRLVVNIQLNRRWSYQKKGETKTQIYSYPMRFAPINEKNGTQANRARENTPAALAGKRDWQKNAAWTKRFLRNIEIMKGAAHGAISPTPSLALRTIGSTYRQFLANLYMPEELLRNRNKHEKRVYPHEPERPPGTGLVEQFREFISAQLKAQGRTFVDFHNAVAPNETKAIRDALKACNKRLAKWLEVYLIK